MKTDVSDFVARALVAAISLAVLSFNAPGQTPVVSLSPNFLEFAFQTGGNLPPAQVITMTASSPIGFAATATGGSWLTVRPTGGTAPAALTVSVNPLGMTPGTYSGTVTVTFPAAGISPQNVAVTLTVTSGPTVSLNPSLLRFAFHTGGSFPRAQPVTVTANSPIGFAATATGGIWLTVSPLGGTAPGTLNVSVNPLGMTPGTYSGTVTVTFPGSGVSPQNVAVFLTVTAGPTTSLSPSLLRFAFQTGGSFPRAQAVRLTASALIGFTATVAGGTWLTVSPTSGITPATLNVSVNPLGMTPGTYSGTVVVAFPAAGISPLNVAVFLTVTTGPTGSAVSLSPSLLQFAFQAGGAFPPAQAVTMTAGLPIGFIATASGGIWLTVSPLGGTAPATLTVSVNPLGLSPGTYSGTVTVTFPGTGISPQSVAVSLTVGTGLTISVNPSLLQFAFQIGGELPQAQVVAVTASSPIGFVVVATGGSWLRVNPLGGTAPAALTVSVNPLGLNPGIYSGTITVTFPGAGISQLNVTVTLIIGPAIPSVAVVLNGASFESDALSPGCIVSIFGTALGPDDGVSMAINSDNRAHTGLAGIRVLFDGYLAPLLFVQAFQIDAIVPFEIAGQPKAHLQVERDGRIYDVGDIPITNASPGLFTSSSSGQGQSSVLNQDYSVNSSDNPASTGSVVILYGTGGGVFDRAIPDGTIMDADLAGLALPASVQIDGVDSEVLYAGSAPGLVAGVIQVNVRIPQQIRSGSVPIVLKVGDYASQPLVTIAVR